ncbi:MAG: asparagine synthase (glutamine-hydrolyzing) [Alphaproteobacteria bacterium]|nr:asparagine synthase (glutamine-hydrolyzing) [Alphaproteobacteria bacterium]MBL7099787.1 asparagine synthase (glutamine-hydrolyzing) [Alphaproteobacteria bacterium]
MCGIAGAFFGLDQRQMKECAEGIRQEISYRGPDGYAVEYFDDGFLLHLRLAIIDLSEGGRQPKWSHDRRYCLTFNGEIYNYIELREELRQLGCEFHTESDTEVLLQLWEKFGPAGLAKSIGMYAFALLDTREKLLYLARDVYGIKPLYVAQAGSGLRFASSAAALLRFPDCPKRVNASAAYGYLRFGNIERNGSTLIDGIRSVGLGAVECWSLRESRPTQLDTYQVPLPAYRVPDSDLSFLEAAERLRDAFLSSVRLHLRSDVPLGFALSGGIDSSAIVCASRVLEPDADLKTFTYCAQDSAMNEQRWARLVSEHVRAVPHEIVVEPSQALEMLQKSVRYFGPSAYGGMVAQLGIFHAAHEAGVTVMLDGQGADEQFAGYPFYFGAALAGYARRGEINAGLQLLNACRHVSGLGAPMAVAWTLDHLLPEKLQSLGRHLLGKSHVPAWLNRKWFEERAPNARAEHAILAHHFGRDVLADRLQLDFKHTILPELLQYEDRNSMFSSVESRVPFLSSLVTDVAFSVPSSFHIGPDGQTKRLLREALRGIVPDEIRLRKDKIGLGVPQGSWLFSQRKEISSILASETARSISIFDWERLIAAWRAIEGPAHPDFKFVWRWVALILWTQEFDIDWT